MTIIGRLGDLLVLVRCSGDGTVLSLRADGEKARENWEIHSVRRTSHDAFTDSEAESTGCFTSA